MPTPPDQGIPPMPTPPDQGIPPMPNPEHCNNEHVYIGGRMVTFEEMKQEIESTKIGHALGFCPDHDCMSTNEMFKEMCKVLEDDDASGYWCQVENIEDAFSKWGRKLVEA